MTSRLRLRNPVLALGALVLAACGDDDGTSIAPDAGVVDAASAADDAGSSDAGTSPSDDGGTDGGTIDAGPGCEELEPTAPTDPANGAWAPGFANPGVAGSLGAGVGAFAFGSDGTVYVGGSFSSAGYAAASNVAAWSVGGGWRALGAGLPTAVASLAIDGSGVLYAAHGSPAAEGASRISRWDGTSWSTFAEADGTIFELAMLDDVLYAVGDFTSIGGEAWSGLAYHDGTTWRGFAGLEPEAAITAISVVAPDDLCVGGSFESLGVVTAQNVACWNGTSWQARNLPTPPEAPVFPPRPGRWSVLALARDPADGALVAGGYFAIDPAQEGGGIARWNGSAWELIGGGVVEYGTSGTAGTVSGIAFTPSGLYIGGTFQLANTSRDPMTEVNDVARWDGTQWQAMGSGVFAPGGFGIGARRGAVATLAVGPGGNVFVGGSLTRADTMNVGHVVRWDGTYWRGLRATGERYDGVSGDVRALARRGTCEIYVGGELTYAGEVLANGIARFTFEEGYRALGEGLVGAVEKIVVTRAGRVYAAGNFTDATGAALHNLAVWDGSEWSSVGGGVGSPLDPSETPRALAVAEGRGPGGADLVYVGGSITEAGGERVHWLAMWDGTRWTDLGATLEGHQRSWPSVSALVVDPETGDLIVAGSFSAVGGEGDERVETNNVARWDGTRWHAYGEGAGNAYSTVLAATLWNGRLTVARTYAEDDPLRFAVWNGSAWEPVGTDQPGFTLPTSIDGVGDALFVAGNFSGGRHAAVFDGTAWHLLGDGVTDTTSAVLAVEGGALFGGSFSSAGDVGAGSIAFWKYAE